MEKYELDILKFNDDRRKAIFKSFDNDLQKSHKYIRKELKDGKWNYIYEEPVGRKGILKSKETLESFCNHLFNSLYEKYFGGLKPKKLEIKYYDGGESAESIVTWGEKEDPNGVFIRTKVDIVDGKPVKQIKKYSHDENVVRIEIPNRVIGKNDYSEKFETTLVHEFAHILQYNFLSREELKELRNIKIKSNKMSSYTPNILEAQAEAMAINELGKTNHSYQGSKNTEEFKVFLNSLLYITENPVDFNMDEFKKIIKDHIK